MRQMFEAGPAAFFDAALPILRTDRSTHGVQYLVTLLLTKDLMLKAISDPALFSLEEATHLAQTLIRVEPLLDIKMARSLIDVTDPNSKHELDERAASAQGTRVLEILSAISDGTRILPVLSQLLRNPNAWVRSKAALMMGRSNKNHRWVSQQLEQSDPRVRANAIESLWGVDSEGSRLVFWSALADPDNRVVGNALIALYRLREAACIPLIVDLLKHKSTNVRITGIWVMGESLDQRFSGLLARSFLDPIASVRSAAFRSVAKLKREAAKFSTGPVIEVDVSDFTYSDDQIRVVVAAWTETPEKGSVSPVSGLKATQFILYENSEVVTSYEVEEHSQAESHAVAIAVPRVGDTDASFHDACVQGLHLGLHHKGKEDTWLVMRYLPEKQSGDQPDPDVFPLPPEARFNKDPALIAEAAKEVGTRVSIPSNLLQAAKTFLRAAAKCAGSRHLVLIHHALIGECNSTGWQDLSGQARTGKVAIHTIALEDSPGLRILSEETGGIHQRLSDVSKLPGALQSLSARLANYYEIRYRSPELAEAAPSTLRVQIYCQQGFGEQTFAISR
jgi:hypothetical protein